MYSLSSGVGLFLCSSKWGGAVLQHQKWGGAVLQISALELQQFCVKPFVGHANLIRCRYRGFQVGRGNASECKSTHA